MGAYDSNYSLFYCPNACNCVALGKTTFFLVWRCLRVFPASPDQDRESTRRARIGPRPRLTADEQFFTRHQQQQQQRSFESPDRLARLLDTRYRLVPASLCLLLLPLTSAKYPMLFPFFPFFLLLSIDWRSPGYSASSSARSSPQLRKISRRSCISPPTRYSRVETVALTADSSCPAIRALHSSSVIKWRLRRHKYL